MSQNVECDEYRTKVLGKMHEKALQGLNKSYDPYWTSGSYNAGRWVVRGATAAMNLIKGIDPLLEETIEQYSVRLEKQMIILKQEFRNDSDDEDGFGCGTVGDCIDYLRSCKEP